MATHAAFVRSEGIDDSTIGLDTHRKVYVKDGGIDNTQLAADAVDGDKLEDNACDSEHYTTGSIDTAHIADNQVTTAKVADELIQVDTVVLTAAQVKTLYSANSGAGVQLVAAKGANKVIDFISATLFYNYDGNAFSAPSYLYIFVGDEEISTGIHYNVLQATADTFCTVQVTSRNYSDLAANTAVYLHKGDSDPTGSSTATECLIIKVVYRVYDYTDYA